MGLVDVSLPLQVLDKLQVERERGITVKAQVSRTPYVQVRVGCSSPPDHAGCFTAYITLYRLCIVWDRQPPPSTPTMAHATCST
jgi:hypothetical protein